MPGRSMIKTTSQLHKATMKIAKPSECTFSRFHFDVKSELCLKSIPGINQAAAPVRKSFPYQLLTIMLWRDKIGELSSSTGRGCT